MLSAMKKSFVLMSSVCMFFSLFGADDGSDKTTVIFGDLATAKQVAFLCPGELYEPINAGVDIVKEFEQWAKIGKGSVDRSHGKGSRGVDMKKKLARSFVIKVKNNVKLMDKNLFSKWVTIQLPQHPEGGNLSQFFSQFCQRQKMQNDSFNRLLSPAEQSATAALAVALAASSSAASSSAASAGNEKQDKKQDKSNK
jgi:hypothetical protein